MKIGLVFSGGGAMGGAHIGVTDLIKRNNINISAVCGCSVGAIVGLLFSTGEEKIFENFISDFRSAGLMKKTNLIIRKNETIFNTIEEILRKNVKVNKFSDLKLPFTCVATDIDTGEMVILDQGDPVKSVMASAAYPGVFPIQKIDEKYLVDGGLTNNFPVSVIRDKCDFVVGSSLYRINNISAERLINNKVNTLNMAIRAIDIMSNTIATHESKKCDFCFYPPIEEFNWYDFDRIPDVIKEGQVYALEKEETFLKILNHKNTKQSFWRKFITAK